MRRCSLLFLLLLLFPGCKTSPAVSGFVQNAAELVTVDDASKAYVIAGDVYEATMKVLVEFRRARKITDAQWSIIESYSRRIGQAGQDAGLMLQLWRAGDGRGSFDAAYNEMASNIKQLQTVAAEVN